MSRDWVLVDEEGGRWSLDNIRTQGFLDGHAPGVDAAFGYLEERAAKLFTAGRYDDAKGLRELAVAMRDKLRSEALRRCQEHSAAYPCKLDQLGAAPSPSTTPPGNRGEG